MDIPKSHYVYEFAYPEEMPGLAGIVFYVGKGTNLSRMDAHFQETAREECDCAKCEAIRSVWTAGFVVNRSIVFTSSDEAATLGEENRRILLHSSPYLTNLKLPKREASFDENKDESLPPKRKRGQVNDPEASLRALEQLRRELDGPRGLYKLNINVKEYGDIYFGG